MDTSLDDALVLIAALSPEYADELSDHAPMVVEALDRLGRSSLIETYLAKTLPKRRPKGQEANPALASFEPLAREAHHDIARVGWSKALAAWMPRLAPGLAGAAFHGTLRVAHAVRASAREDTPARRVELSRALAYAITRGQELPRASEAARGATLMQVLEEIEPSPQAMQQRSGLISSALAERASAHRTMASSVARLRLPEPAAAADELCAAALSMFLHADYLPTATFTLLHAVTGMEAVRTLVLACPAHGQLLVEHGAHALVAMRVAFVGAWLRTNHRNGNDGRPGGVDQALLSLDDHAIKLAAALEALPAASPGERSQALSRWLRLLSP